MLEQRTAANRNELGRDRFVRLAEKRVTRLIKEIRLVGNLSNKNNYSYTSEDAQKILRAIEGEIKTLRQRFENGAASNDVSFKL